MRLGPRTVARALGRGTPGGQEIVDLYLPELGVNRPHRTTAIVASRRHVSFELVDLVRRRRR